MHHSKFMLAVIGITALTLGPTAVALGDFGAAPAYAKGGNGGGNGGGGKNESSSKSEKSSDRGKSSSGSSKAAGKSQKSDSAGKKSGAKSNGKSPGAKSKSAKSGKGGKKKSAAVEISSRPKARDLGKMNGALHANINAVLAHIRNGNLQGPVGLLAALAIADAGAAESAVKFDELAALADAHDALTTGLERLGFDTLGDYFEAVSEDTVSPEDMDIISGLIESAGGLNTDGTALATSRPSDTELANVETAAATGATSVDDAEAAILAAWNKDGDGDALLAALRERLTGHEDAIAEAMSEVKADEAELLPTEESTDASPVVDPISPEEVATASN